MISRGVLVGLLVLGITACASAKDAAPPNPNLTCRLHQPAAYVDSLKQVPAAILAELFKTSGAMADRGEPFNATDVVERPAPFARFIRGGGAGGYWFVWYEHGGIAYWHQIAIFALDPNGRAHVIANQTATQQDLCAETDRLLK